MKRRVRTITRITLLAAIWLAAGPLAHAAEITQLTPDNYEGLVPDGKEVDAIYGDYVIRNDRIVAVVAAPIMGRNANLSTKGAGGYLIDLTTLESDNDQLTAWAPFAKGFSIREARVVTSRGDRVEMVLGGGGRRGSIGVEVRLSLADGDPALTVETTYTNRTDQPVEAPTAELLRADRTFDLTNVDDGRLVIVEDTWWGQAYGILRDDAGETHVTQPTEAWMGPIDLTPTIGGADRLRLGGNRSATIRRRIIPADHSLGVRTVAAELTRDVQSSVSVRVSASGVFARPQTPAGVSTAALIEVWPGREATGAPYGRARVDAQRRAAFSVPAGTYTLRVTETGRPTTTLPLIAVGNVSTLVRLGEAASVRGAIVDESGGPIPAKVQFIGIDGTPTPNFFPDSGDRVVRNLVYDEDGRFTQAIAPGRYRVIISRGPEYDAEETTLVAMAGETTELAATLRRTVDTAGYVSTDYHSHSSPSGDNTSSQFGRVLNLLAEHIEFAPCTEHNRINSYTPHLEALGVAHLMATAEGMELTGSPLPLNHQNAFPLVMNPHTQDWGAPVTDGDPVAQIRRLALWDNGADKLVQQNHPDIITMGFDRDGDGERDDAYSQMFSYMDVIEVHPLEPILRQAVVTDGRLTGNNVPNAWMLLLNQGYRVPGVVNTDAHYNYHGSGGLRNWVASPTDDPAQIDVMDIVHETERGHLVMSTGPFMVVKVSAQDQSRGVLPGDDLAAPGGRVFAHVRVQCPNWLDIDRVQVLVNGRAPASLNFTRAANPDMFGDGVVKFDRMIPVPLDADAHVIVVAIGENSSLGRVMNSPGVKPIAVSNPVFVDVDGGGWSPSRDTLDTPFPAD